MSVWFLLIVIRSNAWSNSIVRFISERKIFVIRIIKSAMLFQAISFNKWQIRVSDLLKYPNCIFYSKTEISNIFTKIFLESLSNWFRTKQSHKMAFILYRLYSKSWPSSMPGHGTKKGPFPRTRLWGSQGPGERSSAKQEKAEMSAPWVVVEESA